MVKASVATYKRSGVWLHRLFLHCHKARGFIWASTTGGINYWPHDSMCVLHKTNKINMHGGGGVAHPLRGMQKNVICMSHQHRYHQRGTSLLFIYLFLDEGRNLTYSRPRTQIFFFKGVICKKCIKF